MKLEFNQEAISQNDKIFGTNKGNSRFLYKKFRDSFLYIESGIEFEEEGDQFIYFAGRVLNEFKFYILIFNFNLF